MSAAGIVHEIGQRAARISISSNAYQPTATPMAAAAGMTPAIASPVADPIGMRPPFRISAA